MLGGKDDWDCFYASSDLKVLAYFDAFDKYVGMWTENAPQGTVKILPSSKNFWRVSLLRLIYRTCLAVSKIFLSLLSTRMPWRFWVFLTLNILFTVKEMSKSLQRESDVFIRRYLVTWTEALEREVEVLKGLLLCHSSEWRKLFLHFRLLRRCTLPAYPTIHQTRLV